MVSLTGGGPDSLPPAYHTVLEFPRKPKRSPSGWRNLFSKPKKPPSPLNTHANQLLANTGMIFLIAVNALNRGFLLYELHQSLFFLVCFEFAVNTSYCTLCNFCYVLCDNKNCSSQGWRMWLPLRESVPPSLRSPYLPAPTEAPRCVVTVAAQKICFFIRPFDM